VKLDKVLDGRLTHSHVKNNTLATGERVRGNKEEVIPDVWSFVTDVIAYPLLMRR